MSLAQIPLRLTSGAFVLNSGLGKLKISDEEAEQLRDFAAHGVPQVADLSPSQFRTLVAAGEIGIGASLLAPFIPGWLAGGALSGFSAALLSVYLKTPGLTEKDGFRPTADGLSTAKDIIMAGAGVGIVLDDIFNDSRAKRRKANKRRKKIATAKDNKVDAIAEATDDKVEAIDAARKKYAAERKEAREKQVELIREAAKKGKKLTRSAAKKAQEAAKKSANTLKK